MPRVAYDPDLSKPALTSHKILCVAQNTFQVGDFILMFVPPKHSGKLLCSGISPINFRHLRHQSVLYLFCLFVA